ncbi:sigma-70 family RNA polymerase sigma factor [Metasolibacillus sp.]|uniref:sigma-70 family RNA polymerase sigma factor n=1 Tax=Metasolibacillus sp. TaxID=2703680 RepID=UPI0025D5DC9F|nr:sigma-70 family RNA polymerase sigma factor [Metasolibacillus sp.]MCT6924459.1 sigma-70 family RNA polymerase sigma factor [Metasolibacillus sp.]MCT6940662.1 sigma-70 family RNA polymerase sigma factor [Metasolibacillus sp.]
MNDIDQIIDEHSRYLVRIAYLYVKNWSTAEDIVQEVFVTFFQKSEQFRQEASLKTYLTKVTANRAKDYLRSWKHKKDVLFETIFTSTKGVEEMMLEQEQLAALEKNLFQLPLKYREPLILFYYDEQSIAEIADYLQLNENTVKTRLRRAKQQLKEFFEEEEVESN